MEILTKSEIYNNLCDFCVYHNEVSVFLFFSSVWGKCKEKLKSGTSGRGWFGELNEKRILYAV